MGRVFGRDGRDESAGPAAAELVVVDERVLAGGGGPDAAWLCARLSGAGVPASRLTVLPPEVTVLSREVAAALVRSPSVLVVVGDGPVHEAVGMAAGLPMVPEPDEHGGQELELPAGAAPIPNPAGGRPGVIVESRGTLVVCLPGDDAQLRAMWSGPVAEVLHIRLGPADDGNPPPAQDVSGR